MAIETPPGLRDINQNYEQKYGFNEPERSLYKAPKGLSRELVETISEIKNEPQWMRDNRLKALEQFLERPMPTWGSPFLQKVDFDDIYYFIQTTEHPERSWDDVPEDMKRTFDKLGIPEAEQKWLAGAGAQYDSSSAYHQLQENLERQGVIFLDMDTALSEHEELVHQYWGTVIPSNDNKLAALNSAVWSGGSFVYIPEGVKVDMPLQAYFRINSERAGQFERTMIIAEEGSYVSYVEGCHISGAQVRTKDGEKDIEKIKVGEKVLTHKGRYRKVNKLWKTLHSNDIYTINFRGESYRELNVTPGHPFLVAKREKSRDHNKTYTPVWALAHTLEANDYLAFPIRNHGYDSEKVFPQKMATDIVVWDSALRKYHNENYSVAITEQASRLIGLYLAEGSISGQKDYYLNFDYHINETDLHDFTKQALQDLFDPSTIYESHFPEKSGTKIGICNVQVGQWFNKLFGKGFGGKIIPEQCFTMQTRFKAAICRGIFEGDGSYDQQADLYRLVIANKRLAQGYRELLLSMGIRASLSKYQPKGNRKMKWQVATCKKDNRLFEKHLYGESGSDRSYSHAQNIIDQGYIWMPISSIKKVPFHGFVYNLKVDEDESYVSDGVISHNCTAPSYSSSSLHSAVVELVAKPRARISYSTYQNWPSGSGGEGGIANLVTKRGVAHEDAAIEWVDCNIGSRLTMKYPSIYLVGERAHGEILSIALAGNGQHQDAGGKIIHAAPHTTSNILSKSISREGGRATYRGLLEVAKGAHHSRSSVVCDALLLDEHSRSDTYPTIRIGNDEVDIGHEASVSKVGEEQLFYLQSHGLSELEASGLIVNGFLEPIIKQLPMEYAVEMNRLIDLEMEGSVG